MPQSASRSGDISLGRPQSSALQAPGVLALMLSAPQMVFARVSATAPRSNFDVSADKSSANAAGSDTM